MTSSNPLHILESRVENFRPAGARIDPNATIEYRRPSPSTTPHPIVWLPGSIPKTRIAQNYSRKKAPRAQKKTSSPAEVFFCAFCAFLRQLIF
jgi:hypothetical protein